MQKTKKYKKVRNYDSVLLNTFEDFLILIYLQTLNLIFLIA